MNKRSFGLLLLAGCVACGGDDNPNREGMGDGTDGIGDGIGDDDDDDDDDDDNADNDGDGDDDDDDNDDDDDDDDDDATPKFDTAEMPDLNPEEQGCGGGMGDLEFSYIWIANSSQNTISKIDTVTMVEEGRYYSRPDQSGNPSRTSVNLSGDVAVANRSGGLTKFYAIEDRCTDLNGNGVIDTSTGTDDVLAYADEECRAWHTPFDYSSQRPVAWTAGEWNEATCQWENQKVWTTGVLAGVIEVVLVDGETGVVEQSTMIPEVSPGSFGFYGGAVDGEGNFWTTQLGGGGNSLAKTDIDDLSYQLWEQPHGGYGMTVDSSGYVWSCSTSAGRFDPVTETWAANSVGGSTGCMEDGNGILWMCASSSIIGVDTETINVVNTIMLPNTPRGVSIDFHGYVWAVQSSGSQAHRVDPVAGTIDTFDGLVGAYTYSDMTGFALAASGGGGPPTG